ERITITNRLLFTRTSAYETRVTLRRAGAVLSETTLETDVAPGATEAFANPVALPSIPGEYTIDVTYHLRTRERWAEAGYEIAGDQAVFTAGAPARPKPAPAPTLVRGWHNIGVHGENFSASFSKVFGQMQSYRFGTTRSGGRELLRSSPTPNFWHAPTANERAWGAPATDGSWLLASRYIHWEKAFGNPTCEERERSVAVTYTYTLPTTPESSCTVEYDVHGDGEIVVTVRVSPGEGLPDMPEFGMLVEADADLQRLRCCGEGPRRGTSPAASVPGSASTNETSTSSSPPTTGLRKRAAAPGSAGRKCAMSGDPGCVSLTRGRWSSPPCRGPRSRSRMRATTASCPPRTGPCSARR